MLNTVYKCCCQGQSTIHWQLLIHPKSCGCQLTWHHTCPWLSTSLHLSGNLNLNASGLLIFLKIQQPILLMRPDTLRDWQLDEKKLTAITTGNAANIAAAIRPLKWPWLNCFGHYLNLAVMNAVQDQRQKTDRALGLCREINTAFSHSWHRKRELQKKQVVFQNIASWL